MSRASLGSFCLVFLLAVLGCKSSTAPRILPSPERASTPTYVSGVVQLPSGGAVPYAKVSSSAGGATFADRQGRYSITVPGGAGPVTLNARDGFEPDKVYAETHFGSAEVPAGCVQVTINIVLDHSMPI